MVLIPCHLQLKRGARAKTLAGGRSHKIKSSCGIVYVYHMNSHVPLCWPWTQADRQQCFCDNGYMIPLQDQSCYSCERRRCNDCKMEKVEVYLEQQEQALYASAKDAAPREHAALREDAALLGLTTAEPELVHPPDPRNAPTAATCTTLEPDSTSDRNVFREGLPLVTTSAQVTLQRLTEHDPHTRGDQVSSTARHRMGFGFSSSSTDIAPEPPFSSCSTREQVSGWPSSLPQQTDTLDTSDTVSLHRWNAEASNCCSRSPSPRNAVPPTSNQPNRSTTYQISRKRTFDHDTQPKTSGAKRPKVSSNAVPRDGKGDKRLLACPFWKKDPIRHRDCFKGVKRIRDVKQHLRRSHKQPVFCPICGMEFGDDKAALSEHLRAAERCQKREFPEPSGMNAEHQKKLNGYSDRNSNERDQWYVIWDYLFPCGPNDKSPPHRPSSPYVDQEVSEDLSSYLQWSRRKGWRILSQNPVMCDIAFQIDQELVQRYHDVMYDAWQAERSTAVQQTPLTLSESNSSDQRFRERTAAGVVYELFDDSTSTMSDFTEDPNNFSGFQVDGLFGNFMDLPNREDHITQMFPSMPLLTYDHEGTRSIEEATLDPTLISC